MVLVHALARDEALSTGVLRALMRSTALWLVVDTAFSCVVGAEPNAVSNLAFAVVLSLPLAAIAGAQRGAHTARVPASSASPVPQGA